MAQDEVEEYKKELERFFEYKIQANLATVLNDNRKPPYMDIIHEIIDTFGWVYPQDCLCVCAEILKLYHPSISVDVKAWLNEWAGEM